MDEKASEEANWKGVLRELELSKFLGKWTFRNSFLSMQEPVFGGLLLLGTPSPVVLALACPSNSSQNPFSHNFGFFVMASLINSVRWRKYLEPNYPTSAVHVRIRALELPINAWVIISANCFSFVEFSDTPPPWTNSPIVNTYTPMISRAWSGKVPWSRCKGEFALKFHLTTVKAGHNK